MKAEKQAVAKANKLKLQVRRSPLRVAATVFSRKQPRGWGQAAIRATAKYVAGEVKRWCASASVPGVMRHRDIDGAFLLDREVRPGSSTRRTRPRKQQPPSDAKWAKQSWSVSRKEGLVLVLRRGGPIAAVEKAESEEDEKEQEQEEKEGQDGEEEENEPEETDESQQEGADSGREDATEPG